MAKGSGGLLCEWILYTQSKHRPQWMLLPSEVAGYRWLWGVKVLLLRPALEEFGT